MRYRWESAIEWLHWSIRQDVGVNKNDLFDFIASECNIDTISDYFQEDMDADGYFEDLDAKTEEDAEEIEEDE